MEGWIQGRSSVVRTWRGCYVRQHDGCSFRSGTAPIATSVKNDLASFEHLSLCNLPYRDLTCLYALKCDMDVIST